MACATLVSHQVVMWAKASWLCQANGQGSEKGTWIRQRPFKLVRRQSGAEQEKVGEWLEQKLICFSDQAGKLRLEFQARPLAFLRAGTPCSQLQALSSSVRSGCVC